MSNPTWEIVAATGHRPQHLRPSEREWVKQKLPEVAARLRDEYGTRTAVSGFALGTDLWWADAAKKAGLLLWPHIPCPQQPEVWPDPGDRAEWRRLLELADIEKVVYGEQYHVDLLGARNVGMLDVSSAVVAVRKRSRRTGGTRGALAEARKRDMPVVHLDPETRVIVWPDPPRWRAPQLSLFGDQP